MIKEFRFHHLVECTKPRTCLNESIAGLHSVLGKSLCSFVYVLDACQGPSPKRWSDSTKKRGSTEETLWSKIRLQSSIVHYTEPLLCQIRSGDQTCLDVAWMRNVVVSKDDLNFKRKITASEFQAEWHYRPAILCKN